MEFNIENKKQITYYELFINSINSHTKNNLFQTVIGTSRPDYFNKYYTQKSSNNKWNGKLYNDDTDNSLLDITENKNITWDPYQLITWSCDTEKKNELQTIQSAFKYWQIGFENTYSNKTTLPILLFKQLETNDKNADIYIEILDTDTKSKESSIPTIENKKIIIKMWSKEIYSYKPSYDDYVKRKIGYTLGLKDINGKADDLIFKSVFSEKNKNQKGDFDYKMLNAVYPIPQSYIEDMNNILISLAKNTNLNKLKRNYLHYMAILFSINSFTEYISLLLLNNIDKTIVKNFNSKDIYGLTPIQYSFSKQKILNGDENINLRKYPQLYLEHEGLKLLSREQNEFNNKNFIDFSLYDTKNIDTKINLLNTQIDYSVTTLANIFTEENQVSIKYVETTYSNFYKPSKKLVSIDEKININQVNKFIIDTRNNVYLENIQKIEIKNIELNDAIIGFINFHLTSLDTLILNNCEIDDDILKKMKNIITVKFLSLRNNNIKDLTFFKDFFKDKGGGNLLDLRNNKINGDKMPENSTYFNEINTKSFSFKLNEGGTNIENYWNKVLLTPQKSNERKRKLPENTNILQTNNTSENELKDILKTLLDTPIVEKISQCLEDEVKTFEQYKTNNKNRNLFHLLIIYKHKFDEKKK